MPSTPETNLGEVWDVSFDPQVGREQGGIRPALVISSDKFNRAAKAQSEQRFLRMRGVVSPEIVALVRAVVGTCIDR